MSTVEECEVAKHALLGETLVGVRYVGLFYGADANDIDWDFGRWHWPEVAVKLETLTGRRFFAIWDSKVAQYELNFAEGPIEEEWLPLRDNPSESRMWDVTAHAEWSSLVGSPITEIDILSSSDFLRSGAAPGQVAPLALRLRCDGLAVWIVVAMPADHASPPSFLRAADIFLGGDEIIAIFGDDGANSIGLSLPAE